MNPPPQEGMIYRSRRNATGRRWEVVKVDHRPQRCLLAPIGDDVADARSSKTGRWQGGVRPLTVSVRDLLNPRRWEVLG